MPHNVFVYGSLKRGQVNSSFLKASEFVGRFLTKRSDLKMFSLHHYPGILKGGDGCIAGEVYKVSNETMEALDKLEGNGFLYQREKEVLLGYDNPVWVYYFMNNNERIVNMYHNCLKRVEVFNVGKKVYNWV